MSVILRGKKTLLQRALAILRRPDITAHAYIPGASGVSVSGLPTNKYLFSDGSTGFSSTDSVVGLVLDAMGSVGSELVTNGDFSSGTGWTGLNGTVAIAGGVLSGTTSGASNVFARTNINVTAGRTYLLSIEVVAAAQNVSVYWNNPGLTAQLAFASTLGLRSMYIVAAATGVCDVAIVGPGASATATFGNISVKEYTGIHASQATNNNKPILRLNSGKYSWSFDGSNDSLALGSMPFQMADDHCVIAGVKQLAAANGYVFSQNNTAATTLVGAIAVTSAGVARALWSDDGGATAYLTGTAPILGTSTVVTAVKQGNAKRLRVNGVQDGATNNTAMGATTLNTASIGSYTTAGNINAQIGPVITIKGTVSDADLLALERLVGQLMGITI